MGELSPTNWQWLNKHTWIVKEMLSHTNSNNRCKMHGMKWPMHNWNQQTKMSSWNVMIVRFCGFEGRKLISCCAQNIYQIYHTCDYHKPNANQAYTLQTRSHQQELQKSSDQQLEQFLTMHTSSKHQCYCDSHQTSSYHKKAFQMTKLV